MEIRFSAKQVLLAVAVCSTLMAATSAASASEWYVYPSSQYGHLLAEKAQMVKSGDTVKFWSVQLPLRGKSGQPVYTKTVYAINCGQRTRDELLAAGETAHTELVISTVICKSTEQSSTVTWTSFTTGRSSKRT